SASERLTNSIVMSANTIFDTSSTASSVRLSFADLNPWSFVGSPSLTITNGGADQSTDVHEIRFYNTNLTFTPNIAIVTGANAAGHLRLGREPHSRQLPHLPRLARGTIDDQRRQ